MIARNHRHRIASAIFEVAISAQVTITHQRNPFFPPQIGAGGKFKGKSAVSTVLQLIGSFMLLYYPFYGIVIWESTTNTVNNLYLAKNSSQKREMEVYPTLVTIASTLLTCSPTVNGLLYGIKNKILRKSFQNYIRKKMTKCELNQEIQARTPSACGSRRPSLTPLGVLSRPPNQSSFTSVASQLVANNSSFLQRRLSEICLNSANNNNSKAVTIHNNQLAYSQKNLSRKSKIPRISSTEATWSPVAVSDTTSVTDERTDPSGGKLKKLRTHSCNNLQIPLNTFPENSTSPGGAPPETRKHGNGSSLLIQRIIGVKFHLGNDLGSKAELKRNSPRILITRTLSEESDKPEMHGFGSNENNFTNRKYSLSTSFLEDKSRREAQKAVPGSSEEDEMDHLRIHEDFDDDDCESDQTRRVELSGSSPDYESLSMTEPDKGHEDRRAIPPSEDRKAIPPSLSLGFRSASQDGAGPPKRYASPDSKLVLQSWPCTKRQYHHIDDSVIFDESDESSENESKNPEFKTKVLRNSCSFMEFSK